MAVALRLDDDLPVGMNATVGVSQGLEPGLATGRIVAADDADDDRLGRLRPGRCGQQDRRGAGGKGTPESLAGSRRTRWLTI